MDLISPLPTPVLRDSTFGYNTSYPGANHSWDVRIGGIPFRLSTSDNVPFRYEPLKYETADYRKQQYDTFDEPGEHSLGFWWQRSQSAFYGGSGQVSLDGASPDSPDIKKIRYDSSYGVDVSVPGEVQLLPDTSKMAHGVADSSGNFCNTGDRFIYTSGDTIYSVDIATDTVSSQTVAGLTFGAVTTDGSYAYFIETLTSRIYKVPVNMATTPTLLWSLSGIESGIAYGVIAWVKGRIMAALEKDVYELSTAGGTYGTPLYIHPALNWRWTAFAEGPGAIYATGYDQSSNSYSAVYKFILTAAGDAPTLSSAITTAELPNGEALYDLDIYLGSYAFLATSEGIRVGTLNGTDINYGPVNIPGSFTMAGYGYDNFWVVPYTQSDGVAGSARIILGEQVAYGRYAWHPFVRCNDYVAGVDSFYSGAAYFVGRFGGLHVTGAGSLYKADATRVVSSGELVTSKITYDTTEPKLAKYLRFNAYGTSGSIAAYIASDSDTAYNGVGVLDVTLGNTSGDLYISSIPNRYVKVKFVFSRGADFMDTPVLVSYVLKSLPAQKRQRFLTLPLRCFDMDQDANNVVVGRQGFALERLQALQTIESAGDVVRVDILSGIPDQRLSVYGVIDSLSFVQDSQPSQTSGFWGGTIQFVLRTTR